MYATIFETWVRLRRGETEGLAELADDLLEHARPFGGEFGAPAALLVTETHRAAGDLAHAREGIDAFAELTEASPNFRALFAPIAARALVALGDVDGAERLIPEHSDARTKRHRVSLLTARAVVAEARGRYPEALGRVQAGDRPVAGTRVPARARADEDRGGPLPDRARPMGRGGSVAGRGPRRPAAARRGAVPGRDRRAPRRGPRAPARVDRRLTTEPTAAGTRKWLSPHRPRLPAMAVVMLRAPLKDRADGQGQLDLPGDSLGEVLRELERRYPRLEGWVLDEHGNDPPPRQRVRRRRTRDARTHRSRPTLASTSCRRSQEGADHDRTAGGNEEGSVRPARRGRARRSTSRRGRSPATWWSTPRATRAPDGTSRR